MKYFRILLIFLLTVSVSASGEKRPEKANFPLYSLNAHNDGSKRAHMSLKLYKEPKSTSQIVYEVPFVSKERKDHTGPFHKLFDHDSIYHYPHSIFSKEKIGEFYKIYYKNETFWSKGSNYLRTEKIENRMLDSLIGIDYDKIRLFDKPLGNEIQVPASLLKHYKDNNEDYFVTDVKEFKWMKGRLWVRILFWRAPCDDAQYFDKNFSAWVLVLHRQTS